jgi:aspartyl protease family protein
MSIVALLVLLVAAGSLAFPETLASRVEPQGTVALLVLNLGLIGCAEWINSQGREGVFRQANSWLAAALFGAVIVLQRVELLNAVSGDAAPTAENRPANSAAAASRSSFVKLTAQDNGHFLSRVSINGQEVSALVDTGATYVSIPYERADELGLDPANLDYTVRMQTANGIQRAAVVTLDEVELEGIRVREVRAVVAPPRAMAEVLLGMSFLSKLRSFEIRDGQLLLEE